MKTEEQKKMARGFAHGATFNVAKLRAALADADWETSAEDPLQCERRIWLGTVFWLTPSGKYYVPFACSNVAGDCPVCDGKGEREPRTGRRARKRAWKRLHVRGRALQRRFGFAYYWPQWAKDVQAKDRARSGTGASIFAVQCHACDGLGSISAARDERWHAALEALAETIDAYVDSNGEDYFLVQSRERSEAEVGEDES